MVIALESSGYSWVERVGLRRAGVGLSRFALFLLVAFVGCQPILSLGPTPYAQSYDFSHRGVVRRVARRDTYPTNTHLRCH